MKKLLLSFLWLLLSPFLIQAQESTKKEIMSHQLSSSIPIAQFILPKPVMQVIHQEDLIEDEIKEIPYRFGIPTEVNIDLTRKAKKDILPNGSVVMRYKIQAEDARSLNLIFSEFDLPSGAWMHIYNEDQNQILGAFTEQNEQEDGQFATGFIFDDNLIIEIFLPDSSARLGLKLGMISYGYRKITEAALFGSSGNCNTNINCPEGSQWQWEKRSVVMIILSSFSRVCTGTLVNNVREDGRPFILSANHCPMFTTNLFAFNYESPTCSPNLDSALLHVSTGAKIHARYTESDFVLAELNTKPPVSYNAYYAGWDNTGEVPTNGTCIHHPKGDVKKISFDYKPLISSGYPGKGATHWQVEYWDKGTTEPASSGSPIFNSKHRVVGQLHGGDASCTATTESDYFGKFSKSWDTKSDTAEQLKYWLDPDNTGATILNGYDPTEPLLGFDAALLGLPSLKSVSCGLDSIYPEVVIKNRGSQSIDSIELKIYLNNIFNHSVIRPVSLNQGDVKTISGKAISYTTGIYKVKAEISIVTGVDQNYSNNDAEAEFNGVKDPIQIEFVLVTDQYGDEISWDLMSSTGKEIYSGGNYGSAPGGQTIRDTFCLYDACFSFNIYDAIGDGICCNYGNGTYLLRNIQTNDTLVFADDFMGADSSHNFCLGDSCTISARAHIVNSNAPAAPTGEIALEMLSGNPPFTFQWSNGKTTQDISGLMPGQYSVVVTDAFNCSNTFYYEVAIGTGINLNSKVKEEVIIYPNPTSGIVKFKNAPKTPMAITVFNLQGQQVFSGRTIDNSGLTEVNLSHLNNGIYFLNIQTSELNQTQRVSISH